MIKVGVVVGTGYTGVELLRLLAGHSQVEVVAITSRAEAGARVADYFPSLRGRYDLAFSDPASAPLKGCDGVFFATPNGVAMSQARALLDAGAKVVDFSADFRLKDRAVWEKWYRVAHASPELFEEAVYGLPESNRERIRTAPGGGSGMLCDGGAARAPAAGRNGLRGPSPPDCRFEVGRERGGTQGRGRHPLLGGDRQLQGLCAQGPSPPPGDNGKPRESRRDH